MDIDHTDTEFQEKEIIRLMLQYGQDEIFIERQTEEEDGSITTEPQGISVGKYLVTAIRADDLTFNNAVCQMIFDEYHQLLSQGNVVDEKDFINHEMEQVRSTSADLLSTPYELSENWEKNRIYVTKEDQKLKQLVDSCLLSFKIKKVEVIMTEIQQKLKSTEDEEDLDILLMEFRDLKNISQKFNQDLSRIITH